MTHGSLFSGIGGFDLGFERAGIKTIWQVEIDPYCQRVLARHFPAALRFTDIRNCGKHNLPAVDILSGGFPCQDISLAGKGAGLSGERSGLWIEMYRLICELRPSIVVLENVAALLSRGFGDVLRDLAIAGFNAEWAVLRAEDFGAPHERARLFAVAYSNKGDGEARLGSFLDGTRQVFATDHRQRVPIWLQAPCAATGVGNGLSRRMDYRQRVESVGNAIVPQIAEWIGNRLLAAEG